MENNIQNSNFIISICIPTYNRANYLEHTLRSITSQKDFLAGDIQICISDNASSDNTSIVASNFVSAFPRAIKYIRQPVNIVDLNFKEVLKLGEGKYLKLNNDTLSHREGSLRYIREKLKSANENEPLFFNTLEEETFYSVDSFVEKVGINVTWIACFGLWKKDLAELLSMVSLTEQLWQAEATFHLIRQSQTIHVVKFYPHQVIFDGIKSGYNFNKVFVDEYLTILKCELNENRLSHPTFFRAKRNVLLKFCTTWTAKSLTKQGANFPLKTHFGYLGKWYIDAPHNLIIYVFLIALKSLIELTKKSIKTCPGRSLKRMNHIVNRILNNLRRPLPDLLAYLQDKILSILWKRSIARVGRGFHVCRGAQIRGGRFITIGSGFIAGQMLWIEAVQEWANIKYRPIIEIGNNVTCSQQVHIAANNRVTIGDGVMFGSRIHVTDHGHGRYQGDEQDSPDCRPTLRQLASGRPVQIGRNVWLGDGVVVLPGVTIGAGTIVGANSVVSRDLPAGVIAVGSPATPIKQYEESSGCWIPIINLK